jgi:hypothetical protein
MNTARKRWWNALRFADRELEYVGTSLGDRPLSSKQVQLKGAQKGNWEWGIKTQINAAYAWWWARYGP